jgi:molecular chaperone DnaK (HSP70)
LVQRRCLGTTGNVSVEDSKFCLRYTGVAWAYSKRPEVVKVVQWGADGTKFKVPSTIRYHDDGRKIWGFDASPDDVDTLQWFKLLLVEDRDMKENIRNCDYIKKAKASLAKAGKQPQEVVKDYLSLIWTQAVGSICKDMRRVIVDSMPFRVVLTVPATWGEIPYVSQRLVDAAELAGITANRRCGETKLDIASEPEAAAFSTLMDARSDRNLLVFPSTLFTLWGDISMHR